MRGYDSRYDWKDDLGRAVARFIINVAAMVPMIAAAAALGIFVHSLFSEPFGFTCKSLVENPPAVKRQAPIVQESRASSAAENEEPFVKILTNKAE